MTTKTLKFVMGIFSLLLLVSMVNALSITSYPTTLPQESGTFTVTVNNSDEQSGTIEIEDIIQGTQIINFGVSGSNALVPGVNVYTIDYVISSGFNFELNQVYSTNVRVIGDVSNDSKTITFEQTNYCSGYENRGRLFVDIEDINVVWGYGDEDEFWYLRDEIEVEVVIDNRGDWDLERVEFEWELRTNEGDIVMSGSERRFNLDEDDENTIIFRFKLDEDMDEFEGRDAVLQVRAVGRIDDRNSAYNGNHTCSFDNTRRIDVITEDDFVIVDDLRVNEEELDEGLYGQSLSCGSQVNIAGRLWNIGEDTQEDVYLEIYSNLLNISERVDFSRIRALNSESFSYSFTIPQELDERTYQISFEVFDEDDDLFENSEDGEAVRMVYLRVEGNCRIVPPSVSARLVGENVVEGEEMTITATVANLNNNNAVYTLTAQGFENWARLDSISPEVVALSQGETREVTFRFNLNDDAAGSREFTINVYSDGEVVATQPISVNVEEGSSFRFGRTIDRETLQITGIILLNVLLIVAIIVVVRRILRKK